RRKGRWWEKGQRPVRTWLPYCPSRSIDLQQLHNQLNMKSPLIITLILGLTCLAIKPLSAADQSLEGQAKEVAQKTSDAVKEASASASDTMKDLWHRIDSARLSNRTPDEIVAWIIMGVLVGALAGTMTSLKPTGSGKMGRLLWGLAGAFLGGI